VKAIADRTISRGTYFALFEILIENYVQVGNYLRG
jgi:hypothetical protein